MPEKGYLRAVLDVGLGPRGAHTKRHRPLDERVAARARLYRRSLALTGIVWCAALVLDHAQPPAAGLAATTANSVLTAASGAAAGGAGSRTAALTTVARLGSGQASDTAPDERPFRFIGRLAADAPTGAGITVGGEPVALEVAAANCPGLPWQVLGAIAQVETSGGHMEVSSAGAVGPMQLLPSTWAKYRPYGSARIDDFVDSATAAARMLCANGAPGDLRQALWDYNHSEYYVGRVLTLADGIASRA